MALKAVKPRSEGRRKEAPARRRAEKPRTIPEQIADHVGIAIVNGEYVSGERLREQELADLYGVSRGPVREAIRVLEKRGLVEFQPRRGGHVVDLSLEALADLFNLRAINMGLAARYLARFRDKAGLKALSQAVGAIAKAVREGVDDPVLFAQLIGRAGGGIAKHCGSFALIKQLRHQVHNSLWGLLWREKPLAYTTPASRRKALADWSALESAILGGRDQEAERLQREIHFDARDQALKTLRATRRETVDARRELHDGT
ncbi:MAG: GntR family transcriptional regulator [Alphaproteobacteria bacterium]|nr:GntR family transcriptional regulator [Alphaproteobacteria bacterium]